MNVKRELSGERRTMSTVEGRTGRKDNAEAQRPRRFAEEAGTKAWRTDRAKRDSSRKNARWRRVPPLREPTRSPFEAEGKLGRSSAAPLHDRAWGFSGA